MSTLKWIWFKLTVILEISTFLSFTTRHTSTSRNGPTFLSNIKNARAKQRHPLSLHSPPSLLEQMAINSFRTRMFLHENVHLSKTENSVCVRGVFWSAQQQMLAASYSSCFTLFALLSYVCVFYRIMAHRNHTDSSVLFCCSPILSFPCCPTAIHAIGYWSTLNIMYVLFFAAQLIFACYLFFSPVGSIGCSHTCLAMKANKWSCSHRTRRATKKTQKCHRNTWAQCI